MHSTRGSGRPMKLRARRGSILPVLILLSIAASGCRSGETCLVVVTLKQLPATATSVVFEVSKGDRSPQRLQYENGGGIPGGQLTVGLAKLPGDLAGGVQISATVSDGKCTLASAHGPATLVAGQRTDAELTAVLSATPCGEVDGGAPSDGGAPIDVGAADTSADAQGEPDGPAIEQWQSIAPFASGEQPSMLRLAQVSANRAYVAWARVLGGRPGVTIADWTVAGSEVMPKPLLDTSVSPTTVAVAPALAVESGTSNLYAAWADGGNVVVKARPVSSDGWMDLGSPPNALDASPPSCPALALDSAGLAAAWIQGNQKVIVLRRWTAASSWQSALRGPLQGMRDPQATLRCPILAVSSAGVLHAAWVEDPGPGKPKSVDVSWWDGNDWSKTITPIDGGASASMQLGALVVDDRGPIVSFSETEASITSIRVKRWDQGQAAWSSLGPDPAFQVSSADAALLDVRPALSLEPGKDLQLAWLDGSELAANRAASIRVWRFQNAAWVASNKNPIRGSGSPADISLSGSFLVFADSSATQHQVLLFHYGLVK
jgi:hypothetical protein